MLAAPAGAAPLSQNALLQASLSSTFDCQRDSSDWNLVILKSFIAKDTTAFLPVERKRGELVALLMLGEGVLSLERIQRNSIAK